MPYDQDDSRRYQSSQDDYDDYDDEYYDDYDDPADQWSDEDSLEGRALAPLNEDQAVLDDYQPETRRYHDPLIIPGTGQVFAAPPPRRRRPLSVQMLVLGVAASVIISALFSFGSTASLSTNGIHGTFLGLSNMLVMTKQAPFIPYRIRSGDTYDTIAATHGIQLGGIYEVNKLRADAEAFVGNVISLPTDPTYGANFVPPLPPGVSQFGQSYPPLNINPPGNKWLFGAVPGQTNPGDFCAPTAAAANGIPINYDLMPPDGPNGHWVRGFTPFHSGMDISTGVYGTPLYATQDGVVIYADFDAGGGGWSIKLNLCGGLAVSYSHMVGIIHNVGDQLHKGDIVGYQGNSGNSFGTHVHYMLWWHNVPIDPSCGYTNVYGHGINIDYHYNGCPPNLYHPAWP